MTEQAGSAALVRIDELTRELAEASDVPTVKHVRDKAEALRTLARKIGLSLEIQNHYAALKLRAEQTAGALLKADPEVKRGRR